MQVSEALRNAYRSTFDEYANKLNTLQRLMNDGDAKEHQIEAALRDVEDARVAHSHARDQLAKELMRRTAEAGVPADEKPLLQAASVC